MTLILFFLKKFEISTTCRYSELLVTAVIQYSAVAGLGIKPFFPSYYSPIL